MSKGKLILTIVIVVVVVGALYWLFLSKKFSLPAGNAPQPAAQPQTLGGNIYEKAQNPIQDKVPSLSPVANPVQGLYKNPFQ